MSSRLEARLVKAHGIIENLEGIFRKLSGELPLNYCLSFTARSSCG